MTFCLSKDDLKELTHKVKPSAQEKVLRHMGIDFMKRPDGSLAVLPNVLEPKVRVQNKRPQMGMVR